MSQRKGRRQITLFILPVSCCLPLLSILPLSYVLALSLALPPSNMRVPCTAAAVVIIKVGLTYFASLSSPLLLFISLLCFLLNVSLTFSFIACLFYSNTTYLNATPSCPLLIIYSFLPDISSFSFIRSSTFISANPSVSRGRSRLGHSLGEDFKPAFLTVSVFHLW